MKKRNFIIPALLTSLMMVSNIPAHATDNNIVFSEDQNSDAYKLANMIFTDYLKTHKDTHVKVAEIDLNTDGVAEIAIRLESPLTCNDTGCMTSVMMYMQAGWKEIFHHHTKTLSLRGKPTEGAMLNLVQDDSVLWSWDGSGSYKIDLRSIGDFVPVGNEKDADISVAQTAALAFNVPIATGPWKATEIKTGIPGDKSWWVYCDAPSMEGSLGRNMVLIAPLKGVWTPVLKTITGGNITVLPQKTNNANNLAIMNSQGVSYWSWNGQKYNLMATSYSSNVTPSP